MTGDGYTCCSSACRLDFAQRYARRDRLARDMALALAGFAVGVLATLALLAVTR